METVVARLAVLCSAGAAAATDDLVRPDSAQDSTDCRCTNLKPTHKPHITLKLSFLLFVQISSSLALPALTLSVRGCSRANAVRTVEVGDQWGSVLARWRVFTHSVIVRRQSAQSPSLSLSSRVAHSLSSSENAGWEQARDCGQPRTRNREGHTLQVSHLPLKPGSCQQRGGRLDLVRRDVNW